MVDRRLGTVDRVGGGDGPDGVVWSILISVGGGRASGTPQASVARQEGFSGSHRSGTGTTSEGPPTASHGCTERPKASAGSSGTAPPQSGSVQPLLASVCSRVRGDWPWSFFEFLEFPGARLE